MFNKIREAVRFEKKNMPDYQYKYSYCFLFPFIFVLLIGALIAIAVSIPLGIVGSVYYLLPVIIWGIIVFIMLFIMVPYGKYVKYVNKRVVEDQSNRLDEITKTVDINIAVKKLTKEKICNDIGFLTVDDDIIQYSNLRYLFVAQYFGGKTFVSLVVHSKRYENDSFYDMDKFLYTIIKSKNLFIENTNIFSMFENNKISFMRKLLIRNSTINFKQKDTYL